MLDVQLTDLLLVVPNLMAVAVLPRAKPAPVTVTLVRVEYTEGEPETYVLPLAFIPAVGDVKVKAPTSVIASLRTARGDGKLVDALEEAGASRALLDAILRKATFRGVGQRRRPTLGAAVLGGAHARSCRTDSPAAASDRARR